MSSTFISKANGIICAINVPTGLTRRRVYATCLCSTPANLVFDGVLLFSLNGAPVLRLPFQFNLPISTGTVRLSACDFNLAAVIPVENTIYIETPSTTGGEFPVNPHHIDVACNQIQIVSNERTVVSGGSSFEAWLGVLSQGKEDRE